MSKTPFKLRSGNSPLFKHMGSSPAKHAMKFSSEGAQMSEIEYVEAHNKLGATDAHSGEPHDTNSAKTKVKKEAPKPKKSKVSYADAFAERDMDLYGNLNLADYTTEAKRQQKSWDAGKGWDIPIEPMTSAVTDTSEVEVEVEETPTVDVGDNVEVEPFKPLYTSRKERRQEKQARKSSGKLSRKEIKYEKLASKAESALAEGKGKKARRLLKRADKQLRKKGVNTTDKGVGKTSDRLLDLDFWETGASTNTTELSDAELEAKRTNT